MEFGGRYGLDCSLLYTKPFLFSFKMSRGSSAYICVGKGEISFVLDPVICTH